jgi:hypothetical protein
MSTRCQIGFYETAEQPLSQPTALIYRHSDGYPETEDGVLAALLPWACAFHHERGLDDAEYAAARGLVALIRAAGALDSCLGYGICGNAHLHGDIEYYYRVDPTGITVYDAGNNEWDQCRRLSHHPVDRP